MINLSKVEVYKMLLKLCKLLFCFFVGTVVITCKKPTTAEFVPTFQNDTTIGYITFGANPNISVIDLDRRTYMGNISIGPKIPLETIGLSHDGNYAIILPVLPGDVYLLNTIAGVTKKFDLKSHGIYLKNVQFHPDAKMFFGSDPNQNDVFIFELSDVDSLRILQRIKGPESLLGLYRIAISDDGKWLAVTANIRDFTSTPRPVLIFDLQNQKLMAEIIVGIYTGTPVFSADSRCVYVPLHDERSLAVIDLQTMALQKVLRPSFVDSAWARKVNIGTAILGPDRRHLYFTFGDRSISFYGLIIVDTFTNSIKEEIKYDFFGTHLAFGNDPSILYMTAVPEKKVIVFDLKQKKKIDEFSYEVKSDRNPTGFYSTPKVSAGQVLP